MSSGFCRVDFLVKVFWGLRIKFLAIYDSDSGTAEPDLNGDHNGGWLYIARLNTYVAHAF